MADDPAAERVTAALTEAIRAGELGDGTVGMVGSWILVGVYHDGDDERSVYLCPDDQRLHETLGLLDAGQVVYREAMRRWVLGDRDETD